MCILKHWDRTPIGYFNLNADGFQCVSTRISGEVDIQRTDIGIVIFASNFYYEKIQIFTYEVKLCMQVFPQCLPKRNNKDIKDIIT